MPDSTYIPHSPYLNGVTVDIDGTPFELGVGSAKALAGVTLTESMIAKIKAALLGSLYGQFYAARTLLPTDEDYDRVEEWLR